MKEKTFLGTFTAITLASVPAWAAGLMCTSSFEGWECVRLNTIFGAVFWIPASLVTFSALWGLRHNCRCKPVLLAAASAVVPYSIVATLFMLDAILPVLEELFRGSGGVILASFAGLLLVTHGIFVGLWYVLAGGWHLDDPTPWE